jgi:hypothetical protein
VSRPQSCGSKVAGSGRSTMTWGVVGRSWEIR